ncbi:MAG: hypothetical protein OEQ39_09840 [Gammaproteobacteria bacterium]|nr:hypothetical protein [Gammaproteobacteria bacterium]MDH3467358.1 hypothetical protein [Gammaproteobacteria bacterium]
MIHIVLGLNGANSNQRFVYQVAGNRLVTNRPVTALSAYGTDSTADFPDSKSTISIPSVAAAEPFHDANGYIGGKTRPIRCWADHRHVRVQVNGIADVYVDREGTNIVQQATQNAIPVTLLEEVLIGPGLILALAFRGIYCLHAGSVIVAGSAVALCGRSGTGKSTIAAAVAHGWNRVTDDILPLALGTDKAIGLPHYPQTKLPLTQHYPRSEAGELPIGAAFTLDPRAATDNDIACHRLTRAEGAATLARHTVASRLFPADLSRQHLAFCAKLSSMVPVYRLSFPQSRKWLPQIRDVVEKTVAQHKPC